MTIHRNIMCVDLGKNSGICIWPYDCRDLDIYLKIFKLTVEGDTDAEKFGSFYRQARKILVGPEYHKIDMVVYEEPHHQGGPATRQLVGYRSMLHLLTGYCGVGIRGVHTGTLKKVVAGHGKAKKNPDVAMAVQDRIGWYREFDGLTHDEIDAAALGIWWERVGLKEAQESAERLVDIVFAKET